MHTTPGSVQAATRTLTPQICEDHSQNAFKLLQNHRVQQPIHHRFLTSLGDKPAEPTRRSAPWLTRTVENTCARNTLYRDPTHVISQHPDARPE